MSTNHFICDLCAEPSTSGCEGVCDDCIDAITWFDQDQLLVEFIPEEPSDTDQDDYKHIWGTISPARKPSRDEPN